MEFDNTHSIANIKQKIEDLEGIPCSKQILMFAGKELHDEKFVSHYGIVNGTTLSLILQSSDIAVQMCVIYENICICNLLVLRTVQYLLNFL